MNKKIFDHIPSEIWDASEASGFRDLLSEFEAAFRSTYALVLRTKQLKFQGLSGQGNLNIMVSGKTPISVRITKPKLRRPVSDIMGLVVGIHMGNEHRENTYAEVLECAMPNLSNVRTYDVTDKGVIWRYCRLTSVQDFQILFNSNQFRSVA